MLSFRIKYDKFKAEAKSLGFSDSFIELIAQKETVNIRVTGPLEGESCVVCNNELNGTSIQCEWNISHIGCFKGISCDSCEKQYGISSDQLEAVKDLILCKTCTSSMVACLHCKVKTLGNQLKEGYCKECYLRCGRCMHYFPLPRMYTVHGSKVCRKCGGRDIWVKQHDFNPLTILQFHGTPKNGIYYGVELEIEAGSQEKCVDLAEEITKSFGRSMVVKHDGSLDAKGLNGLELVTAPGDFDFHKELWKEFFSKGYKFESFKSERCSTHVHISRQPLKPMQLARMAHFIFAPKNRALVQKIGGRNLDTPWGNRYANINQKLTVPDLVAVYGGPSYIKNKYGVEDQDLILPTSQQQVYFKPNRALVRYSALNLTNSSTAELRIFCGTSQYEGMMKNVEFCQALIDFCAPIQMAISQLSDPNQFTRFVKENRSSYPNLYKFLFAASAKSIVESFIKV